MALAKNVMGGGFSAGQARSLNGNNVNTAVTATGTTRATGTALTADVNVVSTATSLQGVVLYQGVPGDSQIVYNATTAAITVYPPSALVGINQLGVGNGFVLAPYTAVDIYMLTSTQYVGFLSA